MFTLVTWNVYCGPFSNVNGEWDFLEWPARKEAVLHQLKELMKGRDVVFCLQEVTEEGSLPDITGLLKETHALTFVQSSPRKLGLLTAIPLHFKIDNMSLDTSGIERPEGWFPGYIISQFICGQDKLITLVNMHASTKASARTMICNGMVKEINYLRNCRPSSNVLWCGDFNSFPDAGGIELFYELQRGSGMYEATSTIISASNPTERVLKTFEPYPDDPFMPKHPLLPFHLDHILVSGRVSHGPAICHNKAIGSDHFPVELTLQFN